MTTITATPPARDTVNLRCMEIWGGNEAFDNAVSVSGMDAWVHSRPFKGQVAGGDIHYISTCGHGQIARFAVADVAGHGADVGHLSGRLRRLMRKHINTLDQSRFVRALNKEFIESDPESIFATALLTSYFAPTHDLIVCNAGHPPPLWYRADRGEWQFLSFDSPDTSEAVFNLPIGVIEPTSFHQFAVRLGKDDLLVIYTDWLIEAMSPGEEMLGAEGVLELARSLDPTRPQTVKDQLLDAVAKFQHHRPVNDDVTLVVLYHNAAPPPRLTIAEYAAVVGKALHLLKV